MRQIILKVGMTLSILISLMACANESGIQEEVEVQSSSLDETTQAASQSLSYSTIDEELSYIEMLVEVEELYAAKVALTELLSNLNGPVGDEDQINRLSALKTTLSEIEVSDYDLHNHAFTAIDAVALAMERYGTDNEDIVYMYDDNHEHYGDEQIGYYVALKSKVLQETEGGDGIVLLLFIGDDGSITEL